MALHQYAELLGVLGIDTDEPIYSDSNRFLRISADIDCNISINGQKHPESLRRGHVLELLQPNTDSIMLFAETLDGLVDTIKSFEISPSKTCNIAIELAALHTAKQQSTCFNDNKCMANVVIIVDEDCKLFANGLEVMTLYADRSYTCHLPLGENVISAITLDERDKVIQTIDITNNTQRVVRINLYEIRSERQFLEEQLKVQREAQLRQEETKRRNEEVFLKKIAELARIRQETQLKKQILVKEKQEEERRQIENNEAERKLQEEEVSKRKDEEEKREQDSRRKEEEEMRHKQQNELLLKKEISDRRRDSAVVNAHGLISDIEKLMCAQVVAEWDPEVEDNDRPLTDLANTIDMLSSAPVRLKENISILKEYVRDEKIEELYERLSGLHLTFFKSFATLAGNFNKYQLKIINLFEEDDKMFFKKIPLNARATTKLAIQYAKLYENRLIESVRLFCQIAER